MLSKSAKVKINIESTFKNKPSAMHQRATLPQIRAMQRTLQKLGKAVWYNTMELDFIRRRNGRFFGSLGGGQEKIIS